MAELGCSPSQGQRKGFEERKVQPCRGEGERPPRDEHVHLHTARGGGGLGTSGEQVTSPVHGRMYKAEQKLKNVEWLGDYLCFIIQAFLCFPNFLQ